MNARSFLAALLFVLLLTIPTPTFAGPNLLLNIPLYVQQPTFFVVDLSQQLSEDGLLVTYKFNRAVAAMTNTKLAYRKITPTETIERQVPVQTPAPNNTTFSFKIPKAEFDGADRLEFQVKLMNAAGGTVYTSQFSTFDLRFYKNISEQVTQAAERAKALDTQVAGLNNQVKGLQTQLDTANAKYEAAQKSLNTITGGLEPQRVNLDKVNLVTDGRIVLTFNTGNIPGRIRATVEGPDGFNRSVVSDNISTQHTITFAGLTPSTPYHIKAVALKLEDKSEIAASLVDPKLDSKLNITTRATIAPPVASFAVTPSHDRMKVSVTSDQDVFAEITYTPLDAAGGTPLNAEQKKVGSIRQDEFGGYTGDKAVIAGPKPTEFTLPDLKENTQYNVTVKLVNNIGKTPSQVLEQNPRTSVRPAPFDFTKATNVEMSPTGVKVVWRSTTNAKEARLQVVYEGETSVTIDKVATVKGSEITGNIEVAEVVQMIAKNKVPILRLIMTDGNGPALQRDLQVSFVMPKKSEVQSNTAIAEPVRSALLDVTGKIEQGKGVDWKKLLGSGLSMVVRAFLPVP